MEILYGFCQCGCGQRTNLAPCSDAKHGWKKGEHIRFIKGHNNRRIPKRGYKSVFVPNHPHRDEKDCILEHILIAEKALGKTLNQGIEVHHFPSIRNFTHLVICQDHAYHWLLHVRHRAFLACGNPHWRKCNICKKYDDPSNLYPGKNSSFYHRQCKSVYQKRRYRSFRRQYSYK